MEKHESMMAILKLYELRRDEKMRRARAWYFSEFAPKSALDVIKLYRDGEQASAHFRAVVSYWDMASSFVLNGAIDEKMFFDSGTEHIFVYTKIAPYLQEIREMFNEPEFFIHLETLALRVPNIQTKMENRQRLYALWTQEENEISANEESKN